ncbi:MAG: TIGR00645 family protein [Xanthobacteraceae bacterium]|nr:TIGR00645 family protein [Xanthobacteraceae bacterium]
MRKFERTIEAILFQSRWTLAPFYLGLAFCLFLMLFQFMRELIHLVVKIPAATEADVILGVLALIDLTFTANLVLIVIFSGYENFVSKFDQTDHDRPEWMAKVDFGGLKQKLMTSIVAISAIQVLKAFMNTAQTAGTPDTTWLAWLVALHVLFLGSLLAVVIADRISDPGKPAAEKPYATQKSAGKE